MPGPLPSLRSSVDRVAALVTPLDDEAIVRPAYPEGWTIADVLSHFGSSAEIHRRRIDDALAGVATPDGIEQPIWAEWDARTARRKVDDGLAADLALVERLASLTEEQQATIPLPLGPMRLSYDEFVSTRLAEHVVHEWDVAVVLDPAATLAAEGLERVLERTLWLAGLLAHPTGEPRRITLATSDPEASIAIDVGPDAVRIETGVAIPPVDLMMPTESFVRLVYGRLDPPHTPADVVVADDALLEQLRAVFPGF
jgi:uncharacterized protein (TIGR03083 family)